jgi:transposase-like protein
MAARYSEEFKQQAVQKLLNRGQGVTMEDIATPLGVAMSSLYRWMTDFQRTTLNGHNNKKMTKPENEKRPEDWSKEQRFNAIVACHELSAEQISAYCRSHGIYAHHIERWKLDFLGASRAPESVPSQLKVRQLSKQNQKLKRDLNRKDKALAETAALLVLQKKVHDIWKEDEDEDI